MTTGWRYVASRTGDSGTGEELWEIRELYPTEDGGFGYTAEPIAAAGYSLEALHRDLTHMLDDLAGPFLDLTRDPPQLVTSPDERERQFPRAAP